MKKTAKIFIALLTLTVMLAFSGCEKYYNYNLKKLVSVGEVEIGELPVLEEVTESDVEEKIRNEFGAFTTETVVTGVEAKTGDYVNVSVDCYNKETSEEIEELKKDILTVRIGSYYIMEGFSDNFLGYKSGDTVRFEMTLDNNYSEEGLEDTVVIFECVIVEHIIVSYPEFTDEFIKENSDFDTYEEYYENAKKELEELKKSENDNAKVEQIWNAIEEASEVISVPEKEKAIYAEYIRNAHMQYADDLSIEFSEYLETYMEMTEEEFDEFIEESSEQSVKDDLITKSAAELYDIKLTEEDYQVYLETQREGFGFDTNEDFEAYYGELTLRQLALETKVSEYLLEKYK